MSVVQRNPAEQSAPSQLKSIEEADDWGCWTVETIVFEMEKDGFGQLWSEQAWVYLVELELWQGLHMQQAVFSVINSTRSE